MLSKAPPVPRVSTSQASEDQTTKGEDEVQENSTNAGAGDTQEVLHDPASADRIVEEPHEVPPNANSVQTSQPQPAIRSSQQQQQLLHKPEMRVPRQADDRLFTWAAVGLTIAIVVLLLKKFMKAHGHSALFTDES